MKKLLVKLYFKFYLVLRMHVEQKILSVVSVKIKFLLHVDVRILHAILVFVNMHFSIQMRNKLCSYQLREEQW